MKKPAVVLLSLLLVIIIHMNFRRDKTAQNQSQMKTEASDLKPLQKDRSVSEIPVKVQSMLISQLGSEHFGNAVFRRGLKGPRIAASGNRILEFEIKESSPVTEVVPVTSENYTNGACALDVNNDGTDEIIVGRAGKTEGTDLLWFQEISGKPVWKENLIANVKSQKGDSEKGFHDIKPFKAKINEVIVNGVVAVTSRKRITWYQVPGNPSEPWKEYRIADLASHGADHAQSGLVLGDIAGHGRQDIVCGNYWLECPQDPSKEPWKVYRYSNWDNRTTPMFPGMPAWVGNERFGGMNQLDLGDMDGDGIPEIIATDAEIPDARLGIFKRNADSLSGLWKETIIDTSLYCPHNLIVVDVNKDNRPDILTGEMTAGGWMFPRTQSPGLYLYLNLGNMKFQKSILHEGLGIHMMSLAPGLFKDKVFIFAADEIQKWYDDMKTHLVGWTIQ